MSVGRSPRHPERSEGSRTVLARDPSSLTRLRMTARAPISSSTALTASSTAISLMHSCRYGHSSGSTASRRRSGPERARRVPRDRSARDRSARRRRRPVCRPRAARCIGPESLVTTTRASAKTAASSTGSRSAPRTAGRTRAAAETVAPSSSSPGPTTTAHGSPFRQGIGQRGETLRRPALGRGRTRSPGRARRPPAPGTPAAASAAGRARRGFRQDGRRGGSGPARCRATRAARRSRAAGASVPGGGGSASVSSQPRRSVA